MSYTYFESVGKLSAQMENEKKVEYITYNMQVWCIMDYERNIWDTYNYRWQYIFPFIDARLPTSYHLTCFKTAKIRELKLVRNEL